MAEKLSGEEVRRPVDRFCNESRRKHLGQKRLNPLLENRVSQPRTELERYSCRRHGARAQARSLREHLHQHQSWSR